MDLYGDATVAFREVTSNARYIRGPGDLRMSAWLMKPNQIPAGFGLGIEPEPDQRRERRALWRVAMRIIAVARAPHDRRPTADNARNVIAT